MGVRPGTARGDGGTAIVRDAAISVLARVDRDEAFADIVLDRALREGRFSDSRDRGLLTELVMGTLRRRGTIDFALLPFLSRPLEQTDADVRNALRGGAECRGSFAACLKKPPFGVRANPFRVVTEALARRFADEGKDPAPSNGPTRTSGTPSGWGRTSFSTPASPTARR